MSPFDCWHMLRRSVPEYVVVESADYNEFHEDVNRRLADGWQVQGGIETRDRTWYCNGDAQLETVYRQAMVKNAR